MTRLTPFRIPAFALLLGLLPFWVFVGAGETKVYNGETIELSHFNLMGFVLAVVGLLMALQWIFRREPDAPRPLLAVVLSIAAVVVCLVQAAETTVANSDRNAGVEILRLTKVLGLKVVE